MAYFNRMNFPYLVTAGFLLSTASYSLGNESECRSDNGFKQRDVQELLYTDLEDLQNDFCVARAIASQKENKSAVCGRYARLLKNLITKEHGEDALTSCVPDDEVITEADKETPQRTIEAKESEEVASDQSLQLQSKLVIFMSQQTNQI